jgi:hypothetical protein
MKVVAEGTTSNELEAALQQFKEGESGEIRFYPDNPLTSCDIVELQNKLLSSGIFLLAPIAQEGTVVSIKFQKTNVGIGSVWSDIWSNITGPFQLLKTALTIPWWIWAGGAGILIYLFLRSDTGKKVTKEAGSLAITAGKMYVTKGALKNPRRKYGHR